MPKRIPFDRLRDISRRRSTPGAAAQPDVRPALEREASDPIVIEWPIGPRTGGADTAELT